MNTMAQRIQVTVTTGDRQITLDGPEDFVRAEVQRLTDIAVAASLGSTPHESSEGTHNVTSRMATEKAFVAEKKPKGHSQTVAVLAHFLTKTGQIEFTAEDVRRAYARAGIRPPKVIAQALRDAKNVHDFLLKGNAPGSFRLSAHGERVVEFDLPSSD
jgi:hypothetical protein